jgi:hypothetical protein
MASNSLSLPVDIPWERWCVSEDMMDLAACDTDRPAKWQSSIAVFKYVPEDDYQVYSGRKITYLKVVCTISGYQPKESEIQGILSDLASIATTEVAQKDLEPKLAKYRPCNEAIIQVTVAPPSKLGIPLDEYPYIMDFQPKKRELFEVGTETNEYMSRSLESLNVRKSSGTTNSQEVLDIDQGFNVSSSGEGKGPMGGGGASFGLGVQGQWGTKQLGSAESGLARTTDESHERRETVSHTTQITHLRHLLDSYHLGTNRAVFFVQPRPNVKQEPSGFVTGPRPIEGIQEFFLIINQPKDQAEFCLDVRLDTGHLYEEEIKDFDYQTVSNDETKFALDNPAPDKEESGDIKDGDVFRSIVADGWAPFGITLWSYEANAMYHCFKRTKTDAPLFLPPVGYEIDKSNIQNNKDNNDGFLVLSESLIGDANYRITTTPNALTVNFQATSRACLRGTFAEIDMQPYIDPGLAAAQFVDLTGTAAAIVNGGVGAIIGLESVKTSINFFASPRVINQQGSSANVQVKVFLKSREKTKDTGQKRKIFFITTRGLCSCKDQAAKPDEKNVGEGIVYEGSVPVWIGTEDLTIVESKQLEIAMRNEMLQSLVSPRRTAPRSLKETKMFIGLMLPTLLQNPITRMYLSQPSADAVPAKLVKSLPKTFRNNLKRVSRLDLLTMSAPALAQVTGLDEAAVHQLKVAMLTTPFKAPSVPKQPKAVRQAKARSGKKAVAKKRGSVKRSNRK